MAKISKKLIEKKKKKEKKIQNEKNHLKQIFINVPRMSEEEYQIYSESHTIIVKNFRMKISSETLDIGGVKQKCDDGTFNIILRNRLSDLVLEHYKDVPKISTVATLAKPTSKLVGKTLNKHINDAWKSCKKNFLDSKQSVKANDIVMAKMKTYSAWPAQVLTFATNKKRASVHFFGTNNSGSVDAIEIIPFEQCHDVIKLLLLRKMGSFHKGVFEIETILGVPPEMSLLKEIGSLK